jgi:hypothetical protein
MAATVSLCSVPTLQFFDNRGLPAAGGTVLTQVGGVNYPTYQDSGGTTALPNPIPLNARGEISNATGATCQLFLVTGQIYTFTVYDVSGNQLDSFAYMVANATSADIANLQAQITAFSTSFTTGTLTVTGSSTLHAVTATTLSVSGASTLTGGATLGGNLAMGGNAITGATNITASGTVTAASVVTSAATPAWSVHAANAQSVSGIVNYATQDVLTGATYASGTITISAGNAGTYLIEGSATLTFAGGVAGGCALTLYHNGVSAGPINNFSLAASGAINVSGNISGSVCGLVALAVGDTVGIQYTSGGGGTIAATFGAFCGHRIGP